MGKCGMMGSNGEQRVRVELMHVAFLKEFLFCNHLVFWLKGYFLYLRFFVHPLENFAVNYYLTFFERVDKMGLKKKT